MENFWRERIRVTWLGLGHLTFGACMMTLAITNAEQSVWSLPQFAFGGAIVTQGFLHLTTAWNIHPPDEEPEVIGNGPARVGIARAPAEHGIADVAAEGLIIHQNPPPVINPVRQRIYEAAQDNVVGAAGRGNVGVAGQANAVGAAGQANVVGDAGQANVVGDAGQANVVGDAGQANVVGDAGQANVVGDAGQANVVGDAGQANVVGEAGQGYVFGEANLGDQAGVEIIVHEAAQEIDIGEADDISDDIAEPSYVRNEAKRNRYVPRVMKADSSDEELLSDIEEPRCFIGLNVPPIKFIDSSESECESGH